ncbi:MAG: hypothetical protein EXS37_03360 [Opitutus sp.]|nr:hypothetical protein [Opitutus sp.]
MKLKSLVPSTVLLATAIAFAPALLAAAKSAAPAESELIAKARAAYPLKTCLVSDEPLGNMSEATPFVYHVAGKPDRVVFLCCDGCSDDFKANPAKFLKKVDDAAAGKKAAPADAAKKEHKH